MPKSCRNAAESVVEVFEREKRTQTNTPLWSLVLREPPYFTHFFAIKHRFKTRALLNGELVRKMWTTSAWRTAAARVIRRARSGEVGIVVRHQRARHAPAICAFAGMGIAAAATAAISSKDRDGVAPHEPLIASRLLVF